MGNEMLGMLERKAATSGWDLAPWTTAIFVRAKDLGAIMLSAVLIRFLLQGTCEVTPVPCALASGLTWT